MKDRVQLQSYPDVSEWFDVDRVTYVRFEKNRRFVLGDTNKRYLVIYKDGNVQFFRSNGHGRQKVFTPILVAMIYATTINGELQKLAIKLHDECFIILVKKKVEGVTVSELSHLNEMGEKFNFIPNVLKKYREISNNVIDFCDHISLF